MAISKPEEGTIPPIPPYKSHPAYTCNYVDISDSVWALHADEVPWCPRPNSPAYYDAPARERRSIEDVVDVLT